MSGRVSTKNHENRSALCTQWAPSGEGENNPLVEGNIHYTAKIISLRVDIIQNEDKQRQHT